MSLAKFAFTTALALATAGAGAAPSNAELKQQVADTERAFAATMQQRDLAAFTSFLSDETVFYSGPTPLRGKEQVAAFWKKFYDGKEAPFSWSRTRSRSSIPARWPTRPVRCTTRKAS